jgi:putative addiction module CopG family antidote
MEIELTPEQDSFIHMGIAEGRFRDSQEAVKAALKQWERRERARLELLAALEVGEAELDSGLGTEYTAETMHELVEGVELRGRARLAAG